MLLLACAYCLLGSASFGSLHRLQPDAAQTAFRMVEKKQLKERFLQSVDQVREKETQPEEAKRHKKSLVSKVFALVVATSPAICYYGPDQSFNLLQVTLFRNSSGSTCLRGPPVV